MLIHFCENKATDWDFVTKSIKQKQMRRLSKNEKTVNSYPPFDDHAVHATNSYRGYGHSGKSVKYSG